MGVTSFHRHAPTSNIHRYRGGNGAKQATLGQTNHYGGGLESRTDRRRVRQRRRQAAHRPSRSRRRRDDAPRPPTRQWRNRPDTTVDSTDRHRSCTDDRGGSRARPRRHRSSWASRPTRPARGGPPRCSARSRATRSSATSTTRWRCPPPTARLRRTSPSRSPRTTTSPSGRSPLAQGVTFHDGTPFDGAAIVDNLTRAQDRRSSPATSSDRSTRIDRRSGRPDDASSSRSNSRWAAFPFYLMGQAGYMASPTWLAAPATPTRRCESQPVGTGPFVYEDYKPERVLQDDEEPELLEQAVPVPRQHRVPPDPRRTQPPRRARRAARRHACTRPTARPSPSSATTPTSSRCRRSPNTAETGYTLAARDAGRLAAQRRPRPLRPRLRLRRAGRSSTRSAPASTSSPTARSRPTRSATSRTPASRWHKTWPRHRS